MKKIFISTMFLALSIGSAFSQIATPNPLGVSMGQVHVILPDPEPLKRALAAMGGSAPVKKGAMEFVRFPGVFIVVEKGDSNGGTVGSVLNHIGFQVKNIVESIPRWEGGGIKVEMGTIGPTQRWLILPGNIRVEILEEANLDAPIKFHHVHFFLTAVPEAQAWYAKIFGAVPMKRMAAFEDDDIPGVIVRFTKVEPTFVPTKGRVVDHIGFEVNNLAQFAKSLESQGVKLEVAVQQVPGQKLKRASMTDPWGASIELTEGLEQNAK